MCDDLSITLASQFERRLCDLLHREAVLNPQRRTEAKFQQADRC
jgi:hypothetical protein